MSLVLHASSNFKVDLLYLDNHILVVNKPPGIPVQADRSGDPDLQSLGKSFIKHQFNKSGRVFLALVHRLDRPVSGVIVMARTSKAAARLSDEFRRHKPRKRYLAIVEGVCLGTGNLRDYLIKEDERVRIVDKQYPRARLAELGWQSIAAKDDLSLLDISLLTGRPHQIRIQLSNMGFPILGDYRYNARHDFDGRNLALHSYALALKHPVKDKVCQWTANVPMSWQGFFDDACADVIDKDFTTQQ